MTLGPTREPAPHSTRRASARSVRVMGVDPGSSTTGYGVIESDGRRYELIECAGVRVPSKLSFPERLLLISTKLEEVMERLAPDACAVEETFYAVNVKSALTLGHVRGVVLLAAARAGIEIFEYSPLEIKSALVGYGRAEKKQVQEMVRLLLKLEKPPEPLDASDALAVAICHANTASTKALLPAIERRTRR
ncbi:MAG TPA: crossover junction endodeoxyribonuclease RuvC [Blastocatellia bacterium]|nr:crossover junction endodeoxyribonuclease RuvC [Blastocatellia bacterium]